MTLPDIEIASAAVHEDWMGMKRAEGITSRLSESGEELMVPYAFLSDAAKDKDRGTVRAIYGMVEQRAPITKAKLIHALLALPEAAAGQERKIQEYAVSMLLAYINDRDIAATYFSITRALATHA